MFYPGHNNKTLIQANRANLSNLPHSIGDIGQWNAMAFGETELKSGLQ